MHNNEFRELENKLSKCLKENRFIHTLGVAYTASCLAMRYGYPIEEAYLSGLLHDCAKEFKADNYISMCNEFNIEMSEAEKLNPQLLHAKLGVYFAKTKYNINNPNVLDAIRYHTTGRPGMTLLEKIVYTADYIELSRDKANRLEKIRFEAFENIDKVIYLISEDTIQYLKNTNEVIDDLSIQTFDYYRRIINGQN